jgi:hypothetical protein
MREALIPRRLPPDESLRSEPHRDGQLHVAYPTATMTLCGRVREGASSRTLPTCVPCHEVAAVYFRIDRSAPAWWFTTSGGAAIPSPVAPPEDCEKDAA